MCVESRKFRDFDEWFPTRPEYCFHFFSQIHTLLSQTFVDSHKSRFTREDSKNYKIRPTKTPNVRRIKKLLRFWWMISNSARILFSFFSQNWRFLIIKRMLPAATWQKLYVDTKNRYKSQKTTNYGHPMSVFFQTSQIF